MMESITTAINSLAKDYDKFLEAQFARYGYSIEDLERLGKEGRLTKFDAGNSDNTIFCIDGVPLFRTEMSVSGVSGLTEAMLAMNANAGDEKYRYSVTVRCVDLFQDGPEE